MGKGYGIPNERGCRGARDDVILSPPIFDLRPSTVRLPFCKQPVADEEVTNDTERDCQPSRREVD